MDDNTTELQPLANGSNNNGKTNGAAGHVDDNKEEPTNERKAKTEAKLNAKIDGYVAGFTVHGLTRVLTAPRFEAVFWLFSLIGGLLMSVIVIYGLVKKYEAREVYTEIKSVLTDKNFFPSITICEFSHLTSSYFAYCGLSMKHKDISDAFNNHPCNYSSIYKPQEMGGIKRDKNGTEYWTNGLFDVIDFKTWGNYEIDKNDYKTYFRSRRELNHSCFTWNYKGNLYDMYSHASIKFRVKTKSRNNRPDIIAVPHQASIFEIDLTKQVELDPSKKHIIKMVKTLIVRQPAPYPSKCIYNDRSDFLPGVYTRRTCIESHKMLNAFKKCGDTTDYMREYVMNSLTPEEKKKYPIAKSFKEMKECILNRTREEKAPTDLCPFPCEELDLATVSTFRDLSDEDKHELHRPYYSFYHLDIQLQSVDSYKIMQEKPLYPWDQMACEIGGFLGLVMGASMLSFIEILACGWYFTVKKFITR